MIDPYLVEVFVTRRAGLEQTSLHQLTARELDVLREIARAKTNGSIGDTLALSEASIEKHVNAIFSKLELAEETQAHRRVAAVLAFLRDAGQQEV